MYPEEDITLSWRLRPLGHLSVESNWFDAADPGKTKQVPFATTDDEHISADDVIRLWRTERRGGM
jgi:hypothetical protein